MNLVRYRRGLAENDLCSRCHNASETPFHCLRDYLYAREVWNLLNFTHSQFFSLDLLDWLKFFSSGTDGIIFCVGLWHIWVMRNEFVFSGSYIPKDVVLRKIHRMFDVCLSVFGVAPPSQSTIMVSWAHPPPGFVKLNIDGSSLGNPGVAGFGGLIRAEGGVWVLGFSNYIPWADNLCVELLALRFGLQLAWQHGFRKIICEVDCMEVVRLVLHETSSFHRYVAIIRDIQSLLSRDWHCVLHHVYREENQATDFLARLGAADVCQERVWDHPPVGLEHLLFADLAGVAHLR